jgi:hypothetical protein
MRATLKDPVFPPAVGTRAVFTCAALAMVACGALLREQEPVGASPFLVTVLAVAAIYWFGDVMDRWYHLRESGEKVGVGDPLIYRLQLLGLSLLAITGLAFNLTVPSGFALICVLGLGVLDSIEIPFMRGLAPIGGGGMYRPKRVLVLKNLIIGAWWSLLLIIGSGSFKTAGVPVCALFAFVQVAIGAAIGNLPLIAEEREVGKASVAARFGVSRLLRFLSLANIATLGLLLGAANREPSIAATYYCLCGVVAWRAFLLLNLRRIDPRSEILRVFNLGTCFLFPLAIAAGRYLAT